MKYLSLILLLMLTSCGRKMLPAPSFTSVEKDSSYTKLTTTNKDTTLVTPEKNTSLATYVDSLLAIIKRLNEQNADTSDYVVVQEKGKGTDSIKAKISVNRAGNIRVECHEDELRRHITWLTSQLLETYLYKSKTVEKKVPYPVNVVEYKTPKWVWWLLAYALLATLYAFRTPIISLVKAFITNGFATR